MGPIVQVASVRGAFRNTYESVSHVVKQHPRYKGLRCCSAPPSYRDAKPTRSSSPIPGGDVKFHEYGGVRLVTTYKKSTQGSQGSQAQPSELKLQLGCSVSPPQRVPEWAALATDAKKAHKSGIPARGEPRRMHMH